MRLLKPVWVSHDGNSIFSIDVHPSGKRFATGGQGKDSGRIVIWNLLPLLNEEIENNETIPKMLCQMDNHIGCVNIVRWSNKGEWLASGGDDKIVMIWKLSNEGPSTIFGSRTANNKPKINHEVWKCFVSLTAHTGDVLDLAWSPYDKFLATCSVDNRIIVWSTSNKFSERVAVIDGHSGLVKGVTWDPIGKYLASQSDDKSLRVWKTADWTEEAKITRPFEECPGTTHALRLAWSTDGQYIVSAHAMNGGGPTAQIVERDGWKHNKDFVGHRKAVTCVSFNPSIFKMESKKSKSQQFCFCAVGSRDRSLSFWCSSLKRPLVVLHDVFTNSVLDLSWTISGEHLLACSSDGTIACINFDLNDEIGKPMTTKEKNDLFEKMYGKAATEDPFLNSSNNRIIESVDVFKIIENERLKNNVNAAPAAPTVSTAVHAKPTTNGELGTHNDRKSTSGVLMNGLKTSCAPAASAPSTQSLIIDKEPEHCRDPFVQRLTDMAKKKQIETRLPNGKRRIKPLFLRNDATDEPTDAEPDLKRSRLEQVPTKTAVTLSSSSSSLPQSNVFTANEISPMNYHEPFMRPLSTPVKTSAQQQNSTTMCGFKLNELKCKSVPEDEAVQANVQNPENTDRNPHNYTKTTNTHLIKVTNEYQSLPNNTLQGNLSKVEICNLRTDKMLWNVYFGSPVVAVAGSQMYLTVACQDQHLYVYNIDKSEMTFPPIYLEDQVVFLVMCETQPAVCIAITQSGLMHMWDLHNAEAVLNRVSLRTFITNSVNLVNCLITDFAYPVIFLTDHRVYIFNIKLKCWQLLANSKDPIHRFGYSQVTQKLAPVLSSSSSSSLQPTKPKTDTETSLINYQHFLRSQSAGANIARNLDQLPSGVTRCFLESQLASCSLLRSVDEYKYWLGILVKHLLDKGPENRLRIILDDLLNSYIPSSSTNQATDTILTRKKKQRLLADVLQLVGGHLSWQRLYNEYKQQVDQFVSKS